MKIEIEKEWLETLLRRAKNVEIAYTDNEIDSEVFISQLNQLFGYMEGMKHIIKRNEKEN